MTVELAREVVGAVEERCERGVLGELRLRVEPSEGGHGSGGKDEEEEAER